MRVAFSNGILSAEADTCGAELVGLCFEGRERLWQNESGEWAGHAPVLFPVCGNCAVHEGGRVYPMDRHGFARRSEFTIKEKRDNGVCFELISNEYTRERFPYSFVFRVRYMLLGVKLQIVYEVENPAGSELYFSCGGHESFALERPIGEYELRFPKREKFLSHVHNGEGRLTGETLDLGQGTRLPLPEAFLSEGRTAIFGDLRSRSVCLCERGGKPLAKITYRGFPNLLLWRPGSAQMICIEPWYNLPDGTEPLSDFSKREGVVCVPSHKKHKFVREITYL